MPSFHDEIKAARRIASVSGTPLRSQDAAKVAVTAEASGEVRVVVRFPKRAKRTRAQAVASAAKSCGAATLVYSGKVRENDAKRGGFGQLPRPTHFSKSGRRLVKSACGALKHRYGRRLVFATLTLAGSTDEARKTLAMWSAKVVELLTHWIRYHAPGADYTYVWEHQQSGALHLHCAIGHEDVLKLRFLEQEFKSYVYSLHEKLSQLSGVDCFKRSSGGSWKGFPEIIRSNCRPVDKCIKRYMSKYLTKANTAGGAYCPARYWGMGNALRALVAVMRRCKCWTSQDWNRIYEAVKRVQALAALHDVTTYSYHPPFAVHDVTVLIYPDEPKVQDFLREIEAALNLDDDVDTTAA